MLVPVCLVASSGPSAVIALLFFFLRDLVCDLLFVFRSAPTFLFFALRFALESAIMGLLAISRMGTVSGSLAAVILAFVLPCACYLKVGTDRSVYFWRDGESSWVAFKTTFPPLLLLFVGFIIAIFSTAYTIYTAT